MKIDITKPVRTRSGQPVTLISDKGRAILNNTPQPLVGYIGDSMTPHSWCADGRWGPPSVGGSNDLVQDHEVWVNVYQADNIAVYAGPDAYHRACQAMRNPIARVRVPYVPGQFDTP